MIENPYIKRGLPLSFSWERFLAPRSPGHEVVTPKPAEWLAEREAFVEKWEALRAKGLREGFLEHAGCYECSGELEPTTNAEDRKYVYDSEVPA